MGSAELEARDCTEMSMTRSPTAPEQHRNIVLEMLTPGVSTPNATPLIRELERWPSKLIKLSDERVRMDIDERTVRLHTCFFYLSRL